ncbi:hypothetical protein Pmani_029898 [Petrolisthes manimaculis]|uniref:Uncharacterized protein n=1 Tax=Petrolisthes manimaculis TaxID=1843537 RepID=A0AAE1TTF6_9EUCA|nr:hypothetical protein Pmani_029898 [Petrolisthes manimaculis]
MDVNREVKIEDETIMSHRAISGFCWVDTLLCLSLPHPASPCCTLPHPAVPSLTLLYPAVPCLTLLYPASPCCT